MVAGIPTLTDVELCESGCTTPEQIAAWQRLIDSGVVWQLQGYFGRTAAALIENGECTRRGRPERDPLDEGDNLGESPDF